MVYDEAVKVIRGNIHPASQELLLSSSTILISPKQLTTFNGENNNPDKTRLWNNIEILCHILSQLSMNLLY